LFHKSDQHTNPVVCAVFFGANKTTCPYKEKMDRWVYAFRNSYWG
jgi:hypothetical protein